VLADVVFFFVRLQPNKIQSIRELWQRNSIFAIALFLNPFDGDGRLKVRRRVYRKLETEAQQMSDNPLPIVDCQLPICDAQEGRVVFKSAIGNRQSAIGNGSTS
jgi:hypothetical protein